MINAASLVGAQRKGDDVENKQANSRVVSLDGTFNGMPLF